MKTPYDWLAKIYTNFTGHMTKMATIYDKNPLNIFSETKRPMALGLDMLDWGYGPYQICTNDDLLYGKFKFDS